MKKTERIKVYRKKVKYLGPKEERRRIVRNV